MGDAAALLFPLILRSLLSVVCVCVVCFQATHSIHRRISRPCCTFSPLSFFDLIDH